MSEEDILRLYHVLEKHWCLNFPYGEACKHCSLELEICTPIDTVLQTLQGKVKNNED